MNVADSEVIASIMQMAGYHVCETLDEADAVFMNTCSIRDIQLCRVSSSLISFTKRRYLRK